MAHDEGTQEQQRLKGVHAVYEPIKAHVGKVRVDNRYSIPAHMPRESGFAPSDSIVIVKEADDLYRTLKPTVEDEG